MAAEVVGRGQGPGRQRLDGLDAFREDPLEVLRQVHRPLALAGADGIPEPRPHRVAQVIPEPEEWAQVGGSYAGEVGRGDRAVPVVVTPALYEAEGAHGIGEDPHALGGDPGALSQLLQGG